MTNSKHFTDDIETIRKIEEQIAEIEKETTESDNNGQNTNSEDASPFKISQVRISMVILLTKVFFRKCSNCHQFLVYWSQTLCC